ncbi:MAG: MCE family protein [Pseudonocardiaceae bacterium]|nr:MCE family protein [Pseudonocardiaceae bacterium]
MRRRWQRLRTVPGLGRNALTVVALFVVGIVAASLLLANTNYVYPWQDRFTFVAEFESTPAVNPEMSQSVTIAGVEVGKITGWRVSDRGTPIIEMKIEPGHEIHDNARAVLRAVNPLNQMYIEIDPGGSPGKLLPEGGMIPAGQTERPIQADEVLQHLDQRSRQALTDLLRTSDVALARAPEQLPDGLRATDDAVVGLRPVVEALQTRRDKIAQLVTALSQIASATGSNQERVTRLADAAQETLEVLARNDNDLRATLEQLPGLSDELRRALTATQDLTGQLDPTLENLNTAAEELPPALERLTATTRQVGETVDEARPVVAEARPVVADLRPLVNDVDVALDDVLPITTGLDRDTAVVLPYLNDLQAFIFNTSSVFSVRDARGGLVRGHFVLPPDGSALPGNRGGADRPSEGDGPTQDAPGSPAEGGN